MFQDNLSVPYSRVKHSNEDGNDRLPQNVGNNESTLHNIPEERRSHLHCGRSLKSSRKRGKLILYYQVEMLCSESRKHEWCITEGDDNDQALNLLRSLVPYMRQLPPTKKDRSSRTKKDRSSRT